MAAFAGRSIGVAVALALACAPLAHATTLTSSTSASRLDDLDEHPAKPEASTLAASHDDADRMTVPVMIDGKGPFAFVVDTGADRTVISRELAAKLNLQAGPSVGVNATSGLDAEPTAVITDLQVGRHRVARIEAPLLAAADIGADGMLGIDSLRDQAMVMDFRGRQLLVRGVDRGEDAPGTIVVYGKSRYGQLILVDASVGGVPIYVILDSGAQNSVANTTLRRMLAARDSTSPEQLSIDVLSVTGGSTPGRFAVLPTVTLGGLTLYNLPIAFADLHTFAEFHLDNRPAMLLGMDALRVFDRVSVDFGRKQVSFHLPPG